MLSQPSSSSQRRRKKRKKKKLPKTSSCARRRLRRWCVPGWLAGCDAIHAAFPLVVDRPKMLGIMAGMWNRRAVPCARRRFLAVACARLVLLVLRRVLLCSLWLSVWPAGRTVWHKKNNYAVCWFYWCRCSSRCAPVSLSSGPRCSASWPV